MFSNNDKISMRQTFRLFLFDFIGISTLLVPPYLAKMSGIYGVWSIVLAAVFGFLYLAYLGWVLKYMKTDMFSFLSENRSVIVQKVIYGYLMLTCILTAGYVAFVFTNLMQKCLIKEESYLLILILLLLVAGYAVSGGIESRARVYEILFWIILIPLFAMLLFSIKGMDYSYWRPRKTLEIEKIGKGAYLVFSGFTTMFFALFFPKYIKSEFVGKRFVKSIGYALLCAIGILLILYLILLGTFGENALASMEFPAVTLMSMVQFDGGFFKRLDAIMVGIWFFTLFALLNLNLFYGGKMMEKCADIRGNKRYAAIMIFLAFLVALLLEYTTYMQEFFMNFFIYVGTPLYILIPGILLIGGKK